MTSIPETIDVSHDVTQQHVARLLEHFNRSGIAMVPRSLVQPVPAMTPSQDDSLASSLAAQTGGRGVVTAPSPGNSRPTPTPSDLNAAIARSVTPPVPRPRTPAENPPRSPAVNQPSIMVSLDKPYSPAIESIAQRVELLQNRAAVVSQCVRCEVLCSSRKHTVFGEGNAAARVCFFGEAPGEQEDATGRPFQGRSGELLTKMIEACTLSRDQVYILNTIKCRPPGNRNPLPDEIANCREYFEEQLQIIQPEYIVCLGLVAVQTLLQTTQSIGKLRSRFHRYHGSKVLATYHPSYLLRYPEVKREAWADLKLLMADMGIDPKPPAKR